MKRNLHDDSKGETNNFVEKVQKTLEGSIPPDQLPFDLTAELGPVVAADEVSPGVCSIAAGTEETRLYPEYYVVTQDAPAISNKARTYGWEPAGKSGLHIYEQFKPGSGWHIISFEILRYQIRHHIPVENPQENPQETLFDIALYGMEEHPDYFGTFPVPTMTPRGYTVRHKTIINGVYWLETDRSEEMLAVCYPIWSADITIPEQNNGEQLEYDRVHGINNTLGYLFFPKQSSCIPLYEISLTDEKIEESGAIDRAALLNALCKFYPEYTAIHNKEATEHGRGNFISETSGVGTEFIQF